MLNELHFMHPVWFWLLLLIPLVWVLGLLRSQRRGQWEHIVDKQLMPFVLSGKETSLGFIPLILLSIALLLAVIAMAGPAWEKREVPVFHNQQAVVVAMDFSASMYAADQKPNRLTEARFKLLDILKNRQDGQTGLVVFAGDAFVVSPLTEDVATVEEQVKNLSPDIMPAPGSLLAPAIQRSAELLQQAGAIKGQILVLTDGANDTDAAIAAAKAAKQAGYPVSILAVGTVDGAEIPLAQGGLLRDQQGNPAIAKVDFAALQSIANAGEGVFTQAQTGDADIAALSAQWQADTSGKLRDGQGRQVDAWVNEGYWLIPILLPLAALTFRRGWLGAALICFLLPQPQQAHAFGWNDLWQTPDQQAHSALMQGQANAAEKLFQNPDWKAAAAYKSQDYATAASRYAQAQTADGQYNYGNALAMQGKLPEAVSAYEKALQQDPNNADAKFNLAAVKKELEKKQQQNQQQGNGQQQPQNNNQQQQQNQQDTNQQQQSAADNAAQKQAQEEAKKRQAEQAKQAQEEAKAKQQEQQQASAEKEATDPQQREQVQATEQWLRRIPDDPAGLWRRKFQYQYQQRGGAQSRGGEW